VKHGHTPTPRVRGEHRAAPTVRARKSYAGRPGRLSCLHVARTKVRLTCLPRIHDRIRIYSPLSCCSCRTDGDMLYSLRLIILFANMNVSRHILMIDTSVLAKSNIGRREYHWRSVQATFRACSVGVRPSGTYASSSR
jgi:hypothetical protein